MNKNFEKKSRNGNLFNAGDDDGKRNKVWQIPRPNETIWKEVRHERRFTRREPKPIEQTT